MRLEKIFIHLAVPAVCSAVLFSGCAQPARGPVTINLKFAPQDSATYRLISQSGKSVEFEGLFPEDSPYKGGRNENKIDMTFTQRIEKVRPGGETVAAVTISRLKYYSKVKENVLVDFDSTTEKNPNHPFSKLIGKTYKIIIRPTGKVRKAMNLKQLRDLVEGKGAINQKALDFLAQDAVKERHGYPDLPDPAENRLKVGDTFSSIKTFSFGLMGTREYEKVYTLKNTKNIDNHNIAVIEMNAIPSSTMAEKLHGQGKSGEFAKMFDDSVQSYTGSLQIDLTDGKIKKCFEKLNLEWLIVDPTITEQKNGEPASVKMSVSRLYDLEKIN